MVSTKTVLTLLGVGLIVQGLIFYAFAGPLTDQSFPGAGAEARHVGVIMREWLAGLSCLSGLTLFLARSIEMLAAKRILFGCAIGFATISVIMIKILIDKTAVIPLPALSLYLFTTCLSLYTAFKKR